MKKLAVGLVIILLTSVVAVTLGGCGPPTLSEEQARGILEDAREKITSTINQMKEVVANESVEECAEKLRPIFVQFGNFMNKEFPSMDEMTEERKREFYDSPEQRLYAIKTESRPLIFEGKEYKVGEMPSNIMEAVDEYIAAGKNLVDCVHFAEELLRTGPAPDFSRAAVGDVSYEMKINPDSGEYAFYSDGEFIDAKDLELRFLEEANQKVSLGDDIHNI